MSILLTLPFGILKAQSIQDVDVTVQLRPDGSAEITQIWDAYVVDGTEWYMPIGNLGKMTVSDLRVWENGQEFISEGDRWDIDRTLSEKAGRCGIVRKGGNSLELCWGQGSYGRHVWTARFDVTGLVQALEDADAFNFMFINAGLVAPPQHAKVTIRMFPGAPAINAENAGIWAFGYEGRIDFIDGEIVAESTVPFGYNSRVIIMARFDKGIFTPELSRDMPFEEMREAAFEGSTYGGEEGENPFFLILLVVCIRGLTLFAIIWVIWAKVTGNVYLKKVFGVTKIEGFTRELPFKGDILPTYYVLKKGSVFGELTKSGNLIGAFLMKWIMEGVVSVRKAKPDSEESDIVLAGGKELQSKYQSEIRLYNMIKEAAGSNLILEKSELKQWADYNYRELVGWPDEVSGDGFAALGIGKYAQSVNSLNAEGQKEAVKVIQFKNFLKDFTLVSERGAIEVKLWKQYLVYAQLYGIADRVAKQFKKLYPAEFESLVQEMGMASDMDLLSTIMYINLLGHRTSASASNAQAEAEARDNGGGGFSSFGGGGGFSGGGFGGGSR